MIKKPFIATRDLVVFPGVVTPIFVGREASLTSLENSISKFNNKLILSTQKDPNMEEPNFPEDIYSIGVLVHIFQTVKMPNGNVKVLVEAKHRVLGRISCPKCGRVYNKYSDVLKPMVGGKCDHCGTDLVSRTDDNEETFNNRFDTYLLNTEPLLKYYEESGILNVVKSSESVEETFKEIEEVIANND